MNGLTKYIPTVLSQTVGRSALVSSKYAPTTLFAVGIVGFVATTVMAAKATLKLEEVLEKSHTNMARASDLNAVGHKDYSEDDYRRDVVIIRSGAIVEVAKLYGPVVILGIASIACLTGSHRMLSSRNASLTAAYVGLDRAFREYRDRVVQRFGADTDAQFRYHSEIVPSVSETGEPISIRQVAKSQYSGYERFFDQLNPNWEKTPEYNLTFLRCQQNYINDRLIVRGHVFLNEVYDLLGIDRSKQGAVVGWVFDKHGPGDNYIDFGIFDGANDRARDFVNGREGSILLDFNVDGLIYDLI